MGAKPSTVHEKRRHSDLSALKFKTSEAIVTARRTSSVKRDEMNELRASFFRDYPAGVITLDTFRKEWSSLTLFRGSAPCFTDHIFRSFDTKGDGLLDFDEYSTALCVLQSQNRREKENWLFRLLDVNGDGVITRDEMLQVVKAAMPRRKQNRRERSLSSVQIRISPPDSPTNSVCATDDFAAECVMNVFAGINTKGDGKVTKREFMSALTKDPHLLKELVGDYSIFA